MLRVAKSVRNLVLQRRVPAIRQAHQPNPKRGKRLGGRPTSSLNSPVPSGTNLSHRFGVGRFRETPRARLSAKLLPVIAHHRVPVRKMQPASRTGTGKIGHRTGRKPFGEGERGVQLCSLWVTKEVQQWLHNLGMEERPCPHCPRPSCNNLVW